MTKAFFNVTPVAAIGIDPAPTGMRAFDIDSATGLPFVVDDAGIVTYTILSTEQVQDVVGALLVSTNNVAFLYNDIANQVTANVLLKVNGLNTGTSKTYLVADLGLMFQRSNSGASMTDTLPSLSAGDNGYYVKIVNVDTVGNIVLTTPAGTFYQTGTTTYTLATGCGHTFVWTGTQWIFDSSDDELDSFVINVTKNQYANLIRGGGSAVTNLTNWNTLYAAAPVGSTFYFPAGTYDFSGELTLNRNLQCLIKGAGRARTIIRTTSATANIFNLSIAAFYVQFEDLSFQSTVTRTAGNAILLSNNNAYADITRCEFSGMFNGVNYANTTAGNISTMFNCQFNSPAVGGSQIIINGGNINMMITNTTVNVFGVDATGVLINQSGAIQVTGCDLIGGRNTLLVNATGTVSALYFNNVFFDQATLGSTVKMSGTGAISRVKFNQCGITIGGNGLTSIEIAGTGTGTGIPEGIDFVDCDVYNASFTGTTTGFLVTGCRSFTIKNSRISGFTFGADITSYNSNGVTNFDIQSNTFGPTENFPGNGTGIRVNVGSFQYGSYTIANNDLSGNTTTPLVDSGTINLQTSQKQIFSNLGMPMAPANVFANVTPVLATITKMGTSVPSFANGGRVGTRGRITATIHKIAATASTVTLTLRNGAADSNADPAIGTLALAAGSTAVLPQAGTIIAEWRIQSATAASIFISFDTGSATGISNTLRATITTTGVAITNINTLSYWGLYINVATAANIAIDDVSYDMWQ